MAKKVIAVVKLQLPAGKATPGPPVGSSLGPHGINIPAFVKDFNEKTASQAGMIIPVVLSIYADRSFSYIIKTPPVAVLIKNTQKLKAVLPSPIAIKSLNSPKNKLPKSPSKRCPTLTPAR